MKGFELTTNFFKAVNINPSYLAGFAESVPAEIFQYHIDLARSK